MWYNIGTLSIDASSFFNTHRGINSPISERLASCLAATGIGLFVSLGLNMTQRKSYCYRKHWDELIAIHGRTCFYCRDQIATSIDHIVPMAWITNNDLSNLVPACILCNSLAGSKNFDDVVHKRQYILKRRKSKRNRRAICTDCFLPFAYRIQSPSLFLCAECYDEEYDTEWAERKEWIQWLSELQEADIYPDAHRRAKTHTRKQVRGVSREKFTKVLLYYYDQVEEIALNQI